MSLKISSDKQEEYRITLALWKAAKQREADANLERLRAEYTLYELTRDQLKEKGTNSFEGGLKIITGFTETYDADKIYNAFIESDNMGVIKFPFKIEYKPVSIDMKALEEFYPNVYKECILPHLIVKPKKPSFSVGEE